MNKKEDILKRLDEIEFHDMPVEKISFKTEKSTDFIIDFALYKEEIKDYDYWTLEFSRVKELKADILELNADSDIEIYRFDYELNELFECKVLFLLGHALPSFEVVLKCETITLNKT